MFTRNNLPAALDTYMRFYTALKLFSLLFRVDEQVNFHSGEPFSTVTVSKVFLFDFFL